MQTWLPLIVALVGVGGTLAASLLAARAARRRDDRIWERELARERERWSHDREVQIAGQRREAYARFLVAINSMYEQATAYEVGLGPEPKPGFGDEAFREWFMLSLFASQEVITAAHDLYFDTQRFGHFDHQGWHNGTHNEEQPPRPHFKDLIPAMRRDLGVEPLVARRRSQGEEANLGAEGQASTTSDEGR